MFKKKLTRLPYFGFCTLLAVIDTTISVMPESQFNSWFAIGCLLVIGLAALFAKYLTMKWRANDIGSKVKYVPEIAMTLTLIFVAINILIPDSQWLNLFIYPLTLPLIFMKSANHTET